MLVQQRPKHGEIRDLGQFPCPCQVELQL
jgi:hypothetical protein